MNKGLVPKLRFAEFSNSYWGITQLNILAYKITERNKDDDISRVFTNSAIEGVVSQEEYFDRNIANKNNLTNYFIVKKGDYIYNPRISNAAPVGPISKNKLGIGVMSPLYTVRGFLQLHADFDFTIYYDEGYISFSRKVQTRTGEELGLGPIP